MERKRYLGVHGNHLEIQAMSEMYNRPIYIYCYSLGKNKPHPRSDFLSEKLFKIPDGLLNNSTYSLVTSVLRTD